MLSKIAVSLTAALLAWGTSAAVAQERYDDEFGREFQNQRQSPERQDVQTGQFGRQFDGQAVRDRYRWHDGTWWYRLQDGGWAYWDEGYWNRFDPVTYGAGVGEPQRFHAGVRRPAFDGTVGQVIPDRGRFVGGGRQVVGVRRFRPEATGLFAQRRPVYSPFDDRVYIQQFRGFRPEPWAEFPDARFDRGVGTQYGVGYGTQFQPGTGEGTRIVTPGFERGLGAGFGNSLHHRRMVPAGGFDHGVQPRTRVDHGAVIQQPFGAHLGTGAPFPAHTGGGTGFDARGLPTTQFGPGDRFVPRGGVGTGVGAGVGPRAGVGAGVGTGTHTGVGTGISPGTGIIRGGGIVPSPGLAPGTTAAPGTGIGTGVAPGTGIGTGVRPGTGIGTHATPGTGIAPGVGTGAGVGGPGVGVGTGAGAGTGVGAGTGTP